MRILYITTGLKSGGAERVVCKLADHYCARGHSVSIVSLISGFDVVPHSEDVGIYSLDIRKNSLRSMLVGLYRAFRYVMAFRADVVHSHMYHANILARFLMLFFPRQKLLCTAHDHIEGGIICDLLYRLTDQIPYISTNVSKSACEDFYARNASTPARMIPIYNGIDLNRFYQRFESKRNPVRLLSVGRLAPKKNLAMLIEAVHSVINTVSGDIELWIVGTGPEYGQLCNLARDLGVDENVFFLGEKPAPEELMSEVTMFVSTSNYEGFGLSIAEAMASGVPVVVTDSGGAAEVVGESGFIVPLGDSEALANVICELLALSDDELKALGKRGRERVENLFSTEVEFANWDRLYSVGNDR